MLGCWTRRSLADDIWLVAGAGRASLPATAAPIEGAAAALRAPIWLAEDGQDRDLIAIVEQLLPHLGARVAEASRGWLLDRIGDALREGRLRAYASPAPRLAPNGGAARGAAGAPATKPPPPAEAKDDAPPSEPVATWIGLKLVDQNGAPVGGRRYRVELSDGTVKSGTLGPTGITAIQGLKPDTCKVYCPYFELVEAQTYVVQDGEHLSEIAERFGYDDDDTIWQDGKNAKLRELRPNPYVLLAGDELYLPERKPKRESKPTGAEHVFTIKTTPLKLKLVLENFLQKPVAAKELATKPDPLATPRMTGGDGDIELTIERSARFFQMTIDGYEGELHVGRLDPIGEDTGVNARLVNLGYLHGAPEEADGDELALAIEELQADAGLPVTGTMDDPTRAQLVAMHGS
jgi:hypothetical protein